MATQVRIIRHYDFPAFSSCSSRRVTLNEAQRTTTVHFKRALAKSLLNGFAAVVLRRTIGLGLLACVPCFYVISSPSNGGDRTLQVFVGSLGLAAGLGMHVGPLTWWMASQLPDVQTRNTAIGISYNLAAMVRAQLANGTPVRTKLL